MTTKFAKTSCIIKRISMKSDGPIVGVLVGVISSNYWVFGPEFVIFAKHASIPFLVQTKE